MGDGWETRRSRGKNFDWIIIKCSSPGIINKIQLDTHHFKGNYPDKCSVQAAFIPNKVSEKNIDLILAGMIAPTTHGADYKYKFDIIYKNLSTKYNLKLVPFLLEDVALNPDLNLDDGMHPNEKGVEIVSKNLEKKILEILN